MRELDPELIEVINGFLDAMDFDVARNDKLIYLVDDNDNTQYVLRYSFMDNTIIYRDILIKEIKQFFPVRYLEAEEILENWFSKKFKVIVDDMDMKWIGNHNIEL
jgi:thermostable 8-oxoguanine DNA glycosylase